MFKNPTIIGIVLFLILLPLVNGLFDWASLSLSRYLGYKLLRELTNGSNIIRRTLFYLFLDILGAATLTILIVISLTAIIQFYNQSAAQAGLPQPLILEDLIVSAQYHPFSVGLWLTIMVLSTLVPTVLHIFWVLLSPILTYAYNDRLFIAIKNKLSSSSTLDKKQAVEELCFYIRFNKMLKFWILPIACLMAFVIGYDLIQESVHMSFAKWLGNISLWTISFFNS